MPSKKSNSKKSTTTKSKPLSWKVWGLTIYLPWYKETGKAIDAPFPPCADETTWATWGKKVYVPWYQALPPVTTDDGGGNPTGPPPPPPPFNGFPPPGP